MPAAAPTMLFDPARHEPLAAGAWDEARALAMIRAIAERTVRERLPGGHWPVHPLDDEGDKPPTGFKSLYLGSAGVLWALWWLAREGAVPAGTLDAAAGIDRTLADYLAEPDTGEVVPSYFLGEVGLQLLRWRIAGRADALQRLHAAITANIPNPTNEALWAAPGTMVAAWHLWQATADERWRELFLANVEQLWRTWAWDEAARCHLWTQNLYGRVVQYLGAGHGFAGNVHPLLKGAALLDAAQREQLFDRCVEVLRAFARQGDNGAANWPAGTFAPRPGQPPMLVQWCHGAPGFVTALADFPPGRSPELDALLVAGGETIWRAGPLAKGHGLCHGTAGNGLAFLQLHRRTGQAHWLDRARAFAMHAIAQCERHWQQHGRGRHTLWTGDTGLAVFLWQCRSGRAGLPSLDFV